MIPLLAIVLLLIACGGAARTGWTVIDDRGPSSVVASAPDQATAKATLDAVVAVTGDPQGLIARGGEIGIVNVGALDGTCGPPGAKVSGCTLDRYVMVVVGGPFVDLAHSALAHELCHLALNTTDETAANNCAAAVAARVDR